MRFGNVSLIKINLTIKILLIMKKFFSDKSRDS